MAKSYWLCINWFTPDWLKNLTPHFKPIWRETKTNGDSLASLSPRFASTKWNYLEFWLVYCFASAICDWLEPLLWFWFYDTQLKTALWVKSQNCKTEPLYQMCSCAITFTCSKLRKYISVSADNSQTLFTWVFFSAVAKTRGFSFTGFSFLFNDTLRSKIYIMNRPRMEGSAWRPR